MAEPVNVDEWRTTARPCVSETWIRGEGLVWCLKRFKRRWWLSFNGQPMRNVCPSTVPAHFAQQLADKTIDLILEFRAEYTADMLDASKIYRGKR